MLYQQLHHLSFASLVYFLQHVDLFLRYFSNLSAIVLHIRNVLNTFKAEAAKSKETGSSDKALSLLHRVVDYQELLDN